MDEEEWRDIQDYEGLYQVSNFGRVRSLGLRNKNANNERIKLLKPGVTGIGYNMITLCNGKLKQKLVHRLVAQAFIPNTKNYPIINHIDGNKLNNKVNNLEWCTQKQNIQHSFKNGLQISKLKGGTIPPVKIKQYDLDNNFIKEWDSMTKIQKELGISTALIWKCCRGIYKKSRGFIWKYSSIDNNKLKGE